jgi:cytochrome c oxidase assembly protein subunit 15
MNYVSIWLKSLILAVMLMVVMGGATRLTHSGLSMVQWKPLHILPPLNTEAWNEEFSLYQQTPEYQKINKGMELNEFKQIYWWEYSHRLLGRLVGVLAFLPFLFLFKSIPTWLRWRITGIFALGGIQGAIGWWMVKSGLKSDPSVSHIRLCTHLVMTLIILTLIRDYMVKFDRRFF